MRDQKDIMKSSNPDDFYILYILVLSENKSDLVVWVLVIFICNTKWLVDYIITRKCPDVNVTREGAEIRDMLIHELDNTLAEWFKTFMDLDVSV